MKRLKMRKIRLKIVNKWDFIVYFNYEKTKNVRLKIMNKLNFHNEKGYKR
jgi:hypothetical protein